MKINRTADLRKKAKRKMLRAHGKMLRIMLNFHEARADHLRKMVLRNRGLQAELSATRRPASQKE